MNVVMKEIGSSSCSKNQRQSPVRKFTLGVWAQVTVDFTRGGHDEREKKCWSGQVRCWRRGTGASSTRRMPTSPQSKG
jgi:hypothetical protein